MNDDRFLDFEDLDVGYLSRLIPYYLTAQRYFVIRALRIAQDKIRAMRSDLRKSMPRFRALQGSENLMKQIENFASVQILAPDPNVVDQRLVDGYSHYAQISRMLVCGDPVDKLVRISAESHCASRLAERAKKEFVVAAQYDPEYLSVERQAFISYLHGELFSLMEFSEDFRDYCRQKRISCEDAFGDPDIGFNIFIGMTLEGFEGSVSGRIAMLQSVVRIYDIDILLLAEIIPQLRRLASGAQSKLYTSRIEALVKDLGIQRYYAISAAALEAMRPLSFDEALTLEETEDMQCEPIRRAVRECFSQVRGGA